MHTCILGSYIKKHLHSARADTRPMTNPTNAVKLCTHIQRKHKRVPTHMRAYTSAHLHVYLHTVGRTMETYDRPRDAAKIEHVYGKYVQCAHNLMQTQTNTHTVRTQPNANTHKHTHTCVR